MEKYRVWAAAAVVAFVLFTGCGGGQELQTRSIGEIHEEEGVPVTVRNVETTSFSIQLSFVSTLRGAFESTASSLVSDEVLAILHEVGDYVEKGTEVVLFPHDNPALNYEQAKVGYESAQTAFNRIKRLYEDDGVSQQAYDDARTQYELARANWNSVRKMTRVTAPISGYITRIHVYESESVLSGAPLFTVSDYQKLNSVVWVSDRNIRDVKVGQRASAAWQGVELEGRVVQVDMAMDEKRRAFAVKVEFHNPQLDVQSGITTKIAIETYREEGSLIVQQREILTIDGEDFVFLVKDGKAVRKKIEVRREEGLYRQVASGIEPGDRIIAGGVELVGDGDEVRIVEEEPHLVQQ